MSSIRVLLIDDDSTARQGIATYLHYVAGFEVTECENGGKALIHLKEQAGIYTVVLLDFVLGPPVTGNQVLTEIRSLYPRLPVIVFTGQDPYGGVKTLEKGAYRYMRRPLDLVELTSTIHTLANQDRKFREMAADIRNLLQSDLCIAWRFDKKEGQFCVEAWDGELDKAYRETIFLDAETIQKRQSIQKGKPIYISDVKNEENAPDYLYREEAKKRGWTTLICVPLVHNKRIIGFIDSYTYQPFKFLFQEHERMIMSSLRAFANQAAESVRNIELSNRLETLQDINQLLTGIFDEQTILRQILAKSMELVGANLGHVYLMDINRDRLVLKEWIGTLGTQIPPTQKLGEGLTGTVAQTGRAQNIPDVSQDPHHISIPGIEINSKVAVALRREEQIIGVLSVKSRFYHAFTDDDVNLLITLATQAAIAIERARLNRHLQEVSRLALGQDYTALLKYVVNAVRDLTFADVSLWMIGGREEARGEYLQIVESSGDIGEDYIKNARLPMDSTISINVLALREKRAIIRSDIQNDSEKPQFYLKKRAIERGWHCFMVVPLIGQEGQPLGVLSLYSKQIATFGPPEIELMQPFANQVAIALQQQLKNRQLQILATIGQRKVNELEALHQTTLKITAQENLHSLLQALVEEASKLLKGKGGKLYLRVRGQNKVKLVAEKNVDPTFLPVGDTFSSGEGMTGKVLQSKKPLIINNYAKWVGRIERVAHLFTSKIEVPLLLGEEVMGVLAVFDDEENKFTQQDIQILKRLAQQGSLAIHNATLLDKSLQVLDALHETSLDIVQRLDFNELIQAIIDKAAKLMANGIHKGICAAYLRCDDEKQRVVIEYSRNDKFRGIELYFNEGLVGKVIQTGKAQYVNDFPYWPHRAQIFDKRNLVRFIRNMIEVPVKEDEKVIAIIAISDATGKRQFSEADVELLERFADLISIAIQNARLVDNAQRRIRDLEIVNNMVEIMSTKLDPNELLETIVSEIAKQLHCTHCVFFAPQEEQGELLLTAKVTFGDYAEQIKSRYFMPGEGIAGWVFEHGESVLLDEAKKDPRFAPARRREYGPRSLLVVPVKKGEETIGLISADQDVKHGFDEYDKILVETLAQHAGIAIERANLFEQIQKQREAQARAIHEIANSIPTEKPFNEILESLLDWTLSLMGEASLGEIRLLDQNSNEVVVKASRGELHQKFRRLPVGKGITGWVAEHKTSQLIGDVRKDDRYVQFIENTLSELTVPMLRENKVIGVLNIEHPQLNAFTEQDLKLAEAIAGLAVVAIENNRLFEQLDDRATRLERLQELTTTISSEPSDLKKVLRLIVDSLSRIFSDSPCVIRLYDRKKDEFTHQVAQTRVVPKEQTLDRPRANGISRYVLKTKVPYYIEDSNHTQPLRRPMIRQTIINQGIRAMAALPLKSENHVIGVLYINMKKTHEFTQNDKQILELFANQAVVVVKNAQLYEQIQAQSEAEIKAIGEIATSIAIEASISRDEALSNIMKSMVSLMGKSALFNVWLLNQNTNVLELIAYEGEIEQEIYPTHVNIEGGIIGWAARDKETKNVPDVRQNERYIPGSVGRGSELAVPMLKGDKLIGVLSIEHPEINVFTESDAQLAEAIAGLAVVALENNRLQEAQERATAAETFAVIGHVTAEFVHRMNNLAGTIPVRVNLAKEHLHHNDPRDARVIKQLDRIGNDTHLLLQAAQKIKRTTGQREREDVWVNQLLERALEIVFFSQPEAEGQIKVERQFTPDLPVLHLDRRHLLDCLVSVIRNAVQAMPNGGTLSLSTVPSTMRDKACVKIAIKDNGVGISAENLDKIFEMFFTTKERGLGYGLWRDKTLIKMLGGDIEAESVEEVGSTFTIKVPVVS